MLEEQLDAQYSKYAEMDEPDSWEDDDDEVGLTEDWANHGQQKGKVAGLAYAIAKIRNPYEPDMDAVREEMIARYEASQ